jgi:hypothetical protein
VCWCGADKAMAEAVSTLGSSEWKPWGGGSDGCSYAKLSESAETLMKAPYGGQDG